MPYGESGGLPFGLQDKLFGGPAPGFNIGRSVASGMDRLPSMSRIGRSVAAGAERLPSMEGVGRHVAAGVESLPDLGSAIASRAKSFAPRPSGPGPVDLTHPRPFPGFGPVAGHVENAFSAMPSMISKGIGAFNEGAPWASKPGVQSSASEGPSAAPAASTAPIPSPEMPDWAHQQIRGAGGAPDHYQFMPGAGGGAVISGRPMGQIEEDLRQHPPITTEAGAALLKPSVPAAAIPAVPSPASPAPRVGVQATGGPSDPVLAGMMKEYKRALGQVNVGYMDPDSVAARRNHAMSIGAAIQQHHLAQSQIDQADPGYQAKMLGGIAGNPGALAAFGLGRGASPADTRAYAGQISGNQIGNQPTPDWLAANKGKPIGDMLGGLPQNISPEAHAEVQRHINSNYGGGQWEQETSMPAPLENYHYSGVLPGLLSGPAKLWGAASDRLTGSNRVPNPNVHDLLRRFQLQAPPGTVNSGIGPQ